MEAEGVHIVLHSLLCHNVSGGCAGFQAQQKKFMIIFYVKQEIVNQDFMLWIRKQRFNSQGFYEPPISEALFSLLTFEFERIENQFRESICFKPFRIAPSISDENNFFRIHVYLSNM